MIFLESIGSRACLSAEPTGQKRTVRGQKPTNQRFVGFCPLTLLFCSVGSAERQVFEPITLTTYATMSYIPKFQIGNETVTIFRRWACPTLTAVCLPNFRVQR